MRERTFPHTIFFCEKVVRRDGEQRGRRDRLRVIKGVVQHSKGGWGGGNDLVGVTRTRMLESCRANKELYAGCATRHGTMLDAIELNTTQKSILARGLILSLFNTLNVRATVVLTGRVFHNHVAPPPR